MKKIAAALLVLLLCAGAALPAFARGGRKEPGQACQNAYVETRQHRQYLGGKSGGASRKGLQNAAERSPRIEAGKPDGGDPENPVDDIGGTDPKG